MDCIGLSIVAGAFLGMFAIAVGYLVSPLADYIRAKGEAVRRKALSENPPSEPQAGIAENADNRGKESNGE